MYKRFLKFIILLVLAGFLITACASTETPVEQDTKEETTEGTDQKAPVIDRTKVTEARNNAESAKFTAENAKAPKAAPEEYQAAVTLYDEAIQADSEEDLEKAYNSFLEAEQAFNKAAEKAEENKQEALKAMSAADDAISKVEKNAQTATEETSGEEEQ